MVVQSKVLIGYSVRFSWGSCKVLMVVQCKVLMVVQYKVLMVVQCKVLMGFL